MSFRDAVSCSGADNTAICVAAGNSDFYVTRDGGKSWHYYSAPTGVEYAEGIHAASATGGN